VTWRRWLDLGSSGVARIAIGGHRNFAEWLPKLASTPHRITSQYDPKYNCIAWAAGDTQGWWEPDEGEDCYWPPDAPRESSLDGYIRAFESIGFTRCDSSDWEPGFEKVAMVANETGPTHASKQLANGNWSGKLGVFEDIEHVLEALIGDDFEEYGRIAQILKKKIE
jgi:hypothetical protein